MAGDSPDAPRTFSPGSGRRRAPAHPKGRQVDPAALADIETLLGDRPLRRDLLIEHLHLLQDTFGSLSPSRLAALSHLMRLSLTEVYEVATFYAHFDVLDDADPAPSPITVRVCDSVSCFINGAEDLYQELRARLGPDVRVLRAPCVGQCDRAPAAFVGKCLIERATAGRVSEAVSAGRNDATIPPRANGLDAYLASGGYRLLGDCRAGRLTREGVVEAVEVSGLRGLGGAGFKSGHKWRLVLQSPRPRLMAVNGDEGEPGTFKDRVHLEADPHRFLEGMLIAAWAVEADEVYIYLRDEYPHLHLLLSREIAALESSGLGSSPRIHLRRGAGAYICGEETAMLESIEGKRGYPRHKPPYPTQVGLFGRPTLIHNVETLYWIRDVLERGPDWLASEGRNGRKGLRSFSVSGRVRSPGVKLAPAGTTVRELIEEHCGGMLEGHTFKAYLPGGASGGILPAHLGDIPLDFGTLEAYGCFIGSAAVVVFSDQDDLKAVALNLMRFFEDESCGQCTPCRLGTEKAVSLMSEPRWDGNLLSQLSATMRDASICGLGQAAPNPLMSILRYFPEELR